MKLILFLFLKVVLRISGQVFSVRHTIDANTHAPKRLTFKLDGGATLSFIFTKHIVERLNVGIITTTRRKYVRCTMSPEFCNASGDAAPWCSMSVEAPMYIERWFGKYGIDTIIADMLFDNYVKWVRCTHGQE